MTDPNRLSETADSLSLSRLYHKAARIFLGAVLPVFVLARFTTQDMAFQAALITLLTVLSLVFTVLSLDAFELKAHLAADDEE